jgi:hypothetical protein
MMKGLLALSLASGLVAPQFALAIESRLDDEGPRQASISRGLPLPPIPYLDTLPWINLGLEKGPRIDTLLRPDLHFSPFPNNSAVASIKRNASSRFEAE